MLVAGSGSHQVPRSASMPVGSGSTCFGVLLALRTTPDGLPDPGISDQPETDRRPLCTSKSGRDVAWRDISERSETVRHAICRSLYCAKGCCQRLESAFAIMSAFLPASLCSGLRLPVCNGARLKRVLDRADHPQEVADQLDKLFDRQLDDALVVIAENRHPKRFVANEPTKREQDDGPGKQQRQTRRRPDSRQRNLESSPVPVGVSDDQSTDDAPGPARDCRRRNDRESSRAHESGKRVPDRRNGMRSGVATGSTSQPTHDQAAAPRMMAWIISTGENSLVP